MAARRAYGSRQLPVLLLPDVPSFPDPVLADAEGLLAIGGALAPDWLLTAYRRGIFPWYEDGYPILWWSPDPRLVLDFDRLKVSRSLAKRLRRGEFVIRFDTAFEQVIERCARKRRPGQRGTWITAEMRDAYLELHRIGHAHSIEAWAGDELQGGLYGVALGTVFFGESMFSDRTDASKAALVGLVERLRRTGFEFIDCQVPTEHLESLGAAQVARAEFLARLASAVERPGTPGSWAGEAPAPSAHDVASDAGARP